ncbi:DsbA family protein, partial [Mycobacterium talmoniae]|uniref:DsbA family protein n=1 Tax=Mycobacterium talmoniae TaxID=1858794 RepID=UPI000A77328F
GYLVLRNAGHSGAHRAESGTRGQAVRVASSTLITQPGSDEPKAVVSLYEDFLCPACGNFERTFGPTVSRLIAAGAVAADYYPVAILDGPATDHYSSRAGAAAYCVADQSTDAFRRFHDTLFTPQVQPEEIGGVYPDNARLIEFAQQAGAGGDVAACINGDKYLDRVKGMAKSSGIRATPTVRINGEEYNFSTPDDLVGKIKEIVGDVPGL